MNHYNHQPSGPVTNAINSIRSEKLISRINFGRIVLDNQIKRRDNWQWNMELHFQKKIFDFETVRRCRFLTTQLSHH